MPAHVNPVPRILIGLFVVMAWCHVVSPVAVGQKSDPSRFATSGSRSDYVHRIELFDINNTRITPGNANQPYSPKNTCGRCHDYAHITTGFHFNADSTVQEHGRPAESWVWVDPTTGTQLPISYRNWKNSFTPDELGISHWQFTQKFGARTAGGYSHKTTDQETSVSQASPDQTQAPVDRFHLSGHLETDCMICHSRGSAFDVESWAKQIEAQNFAWAPTAAIGLAKVDGQVRRLKDDFDVAASKAEDYRGPTLPKTNFDESRFDADGKVFFDIVRFPPNNACYRCHSNVSAGNNASPRWAHDQDVHMRAGLQCIDCHRNGIGHNIVRGFEGEVHPDQQFVTNLSCRGCHMDSETDGLAYQTSGGRLGAPKPLHKGLPPIHLERMSCTSCHSGPLLTDEIGLLQTALAHRLGLKDNRKATNQPKILRSVLMPDENNVLYPYRVMWPSYWGIKDGDKLRPLNPDDVNKQLRSTLRVRKDFGEEMTIVRLSAAQKADVLGEDRAKLKPDELTDQEKSKLAEFEAIEGVKAFHAKIEKALLKLRKDIEQGQPIYVAGESIYQLSADDKIEIVANPDPRPYSWPIGHDVRPARWALGANGCTDCHADNSPFFYADVVAQSPVPPSEPTRRPMHEYSKLDAQLLGTWNQVFQGRTAFKWTAMLSVASVALAIVVGLLFSFAGIYSKLRNRS